MWGPRRESRSKLRICGVGEGTGSDCAKNADPGGEPVLGDDEAVVVLGAKPAYRALTTLPSRITNPMSSITRMFLSGSPSTAITSALNLRAAVSAGATGRLGTPFPPAAALAKAFRRARPPRRVPPWIAKPARALINSLCFGHHSDSIAHAALPAASALAFRIPTSSGACPRSAARDSWWPRSPGLRR